MKAETEMGKGVFTRASQSADLTNLVSSWLQLENSTASSPGICDYGCAAEATQRETQGLTLL